MSSDSQLAAILGEPPRKRRAAAMAAQKNWQMLHNPDEPEDDDLIEVTQVIKNTPNVQKVAQISNIITPSGKRTPLVNNIIIDLNRNKRTTTVIDRDYTPELDFVRQTQTQTLPQNLRARKSFPAPPLQTRNQITNQINIQTVNRLPRGQPTVLIETDTSKRVIARTDGTHYRKPAVVKLAPGEPIDNPIVEGEEEIIVGTYEDDLLMDENNEFEDTVEELSLILFCESENKSSEDTKDLNDSKDDIEVIEVIENKNSQRVGTTRGPPKRIQTIHSNRLKSQKGLLEPIIDTLEMECENFDDEFTDGLCFDCEEDILNEKQWKKSIEQKKEYMDYSKSVTSSKNVKFLPEVEVTQALGIETTIVSETTRIVTTPTPSRMNVRTRAQPITIQSVRAPIPSLVNQSTPLRPQIRQTIVNTQTSVPNRMPFTIIPVSSGSGVTNPLIISSPNFVNTIGGSNLRLLLQPGVTQPTYVMVPRSSVMNRFSSQNLFISNTNPILTTNRGFTSLANAFQVPNRPTILRSTAIRSAPPTATQFVRPTAIINPNVSMVSNGSIRIQNYSNANKTQNSLNPLFDCLTVFKGTQNASKKINMRNILTIKPLPFSWPSNIDALINSLIKLDKALMKEKFKESPIAWMVTSNLILPPNCKTCNIGICNVVNKTLNAKNEYWHCNNPSCRRSFLIDRPRIFEGSKFDIPVSKLLFLIYYWSIQVDVEDLIKTGQIEMGTEKIFNVWNRLQKVCSTALSTKDEKLGPTVEVCSVQVGRFHVLGAMEKYTHRTRLSVVPIHEIIQKNGQQAVMLPFVKWLARNCNVVTCEPKFMALTQYGYKVTVQSKNEFLAQNKNLSLTTISGYLIHHLQRFFKDMDLSTLSTDILSNILDELLWRERYGNNPFTAFYNIIKHISEQCGLRKPHIPPTIVQTNIPTGIRTPTAAVVSAAFKARTPIPTQSQTYSRPVVPELNETNSVFVDEYYYSSLTLKTSFAKTQSQEELTKDSIQCHLCQMFFDNILIVKHLLEHLEKERHGRVRKGDNNEPECKHCLRFFSNRALHMHEELANMKVIPFSCRICLQPLLARQPFIGHMKTNHFSGEMPYYCDICSYRSSFQKSLFDHFEASHSNSSQVMCPFCIRVFNVTKFKNISSFLYRHLTTHYAVASVYDCDKCVLTFTSKPDLKDHCFKGHNPSNAVDEKFEITPHKVGEQEKSMCTRAREQELFTPFLPNIESAPNYGQSSAANEGEGDNEAINFEMSCDVQDFFSIEPEIQINLTEGSASVTDFILPVDCDYSNEKLTQILTKSFQINESKNEEQTQPIEGVEPNPISEPIPEPNPEPSSEVSQKYYILSNNQRVVCFECKTEITTDHFMSRMFCLKCNFTSHCKTSFEEHNTSAHLNDSDQKIKESSVFGSFANLVSYKNVCKTCGFLSTDGNQIALHMIESNHFDILCKPLDFEEKTILMPNPNPNPNPQTETLCSQDLTTN